MKNIGKYQGIPCYQCAFHEWFKAHNNGIDNGRRIFIIDEVMVKNNKIIGYYDGTHVKDVYDEKTYWVAEPVEAIEEAKTAKVTPKTSSATGTKVEEVEVKEIIFSDYSRVVDDFFANLPTG